MKKMLCLMLALATVLMLFAGCASKEEPKKTLTVAMSPDFAPMEFVDSSKSGQDQYVGFDVSLAKYIAEELGMELVISPMTFNACEQAVAEGTADMAISGFVWKADRAEKYNLTDYYYASGEQVILVLKENEGMFGSTEDFAGLTVAAQNGSLQEDLCKDQLAGAEIVTIGDLEVALHQLRAGDFIGLAVAKSLADVFLANHSDVALSGFSFEVDPDAGYVALLKKGNDELTKKVNEILANAEAAGLYEQWYAEAEALAEAIGAE